MKKKVKWIIWSLLILAVAGYASYTYFLPLAAPLLELRLQTVERSFTESGKVVSAVEVEIFSPTGGMVAALPARQGAEVKEGDLLAAMDTQELMYKLAQLEGQLLGIQGQRSIALREPSPAHVEQQLLVIEQAKNVVKKAEENLEKLLTAPVGGEENDQAIAEAENALDEARNNLERQELALDLLHEKITPPPGTQEQFTGLLKSLQAQKDLLKLQLERSSIYAPLSATIKAVYVEEGSVVPPGAPLLSLYQPGSYQAELYLLSADMEELQVGMPVEVTYLGNIRDHLFEGLVYAIAPAAVETISPLGLVEQRVKVTVELTGATEILRPGYEVEAKFVTHREEEKLAVPAAALFTADGADSVWVVADGRAELRQVTKGLEAGELVVIEEGLQPGEKIIRNPRLAGLTEGKRIREQ